MQLTHIISALAVVGLAAAAPVAEANGDKCQTLYKTSTVTTTSKCPIVSLPLSPIVTGTLVPVQSITSALGVRAPHDKEPKTTSTAPAPLVSLPLSPLVTGTIVPVGSILGDLGITARAPEPTAAAMEPRNNCQVYSTKTVTTTVKPSCGIVNPGSINLKARVAAVFN